MKKTAVFVFAIVASLGAADVVDDGKNVTEATAAATTAVVTQTILKEMPAGKLPFRVCVLDFTVIDILGQKRFLDQRNNPIVIPPQCTLTDADRETMNGVMQGYVRMIDAWDNTRTNDANRGAQVDDNVFTREKALELYNGIVKGEARPMIIGAEYLSAYLGKHNDVFSCVEASQVMAAMNKLRNEPDFPRDFMLRLARESGATHLIYGVVSDLSTKSNSFKGYGIETKTTNYQLDVIVKLVDLAAQGTVYSNVYTGNYREQRPVSNEQLDNNIFQSLMKSALEQAAEDFYDVCKPGRKNRVKMTPMPCFVTVNPSDGSISFNPEEVEIFADGKRVGVGGTRFQLAPGKHQIEIKAPEYGSQSFDVDISADQTIEVKLEKKE